MARITEPEIYPAFEGYPSAAFEFLHDLRQNNSREWFTARKQQYENDLVFPTRCLISSLAEQLQDDYPYLEFHPKRSVFRIYRDTRFSSDKSPYKTNIGAQFTASRKIGVEMPGLYVHIEPSAVFVAGGLYMPNSQQLLTLRNAIVRNPNDFASMLNEPSFAQYWKGIEGERLKKAPLGFNATHKMIEYLKQKQWYVSHELNPDAPLSSNFVLEISSLCLAMKPLMNWLVENLETPTTN